MKKDTHSFFRIQQEPSDSPNRQINRRYSQNDTSDQWNFGGGRAKRYFAPYNSRIVTIGFIGISLLLILTGRLFQLQIVEGAEYRSESEGNRVRTQIIPSPRGTIYDRNGIPLVKNDPTFYVAFIAADIPRDEVIYKDQLRIISDISGIPAQTLDEQISSVSPISFRPVSLIDNLTYEEIISLKSRLDNWSGFEVGLRGSRSYPFAQYTSHVLGYLGKITADDIAEGVVDDGYQLTDYIGKSGIELQYESLLKGKAGKREVEINVRGQVQRVSSEVEPITGADITLTIDSEIQTKLYDVLVDKLDDLELTKGAAVAINPQNGEVLAAISLPSYDNNIFSKPIDSATYASTIATEDQPLFFRPIQGEYPSGSTFKPVVALAALIENVVTPRTTFFSQGGLQVNAWFFPDWQAGGHGTTDVIKALAESVNTYFYYIGGGYDSFTGLGVDRIVEHAKKLGFTTKLGLDYPVEGDGFLPSRAWKEEFKQERWYIGDTYNISIGQGDVLVTPLQTTAMMSFLANGGVLYKPHLLKTISYSDGTVQDVTPEVLYENTTEQQNISIIRQGLKATGDWGSARSLNALDPFEVAGKTGTAQVGGNQEPHAWFTSFAPYENPDIALTILIENGETSNHAVAVAREFFIWYKDYVTQ
ncbi:MAG: penicillin-binding protein 2 [Patescibacteria group bacterium]